MEPGRLSSLPRSDDGRLVYFVLVDTPLGSMAEKVVIDTRRSLILANRPQSSEPNPIALAAAMMPIMRNRSDRSRPLSWVQIGSMAGATVAVPSVALRSANFQILGSGQGSVSTAGILAELPALAEQLSIGTFKLNAQSVPLADVERVWNAPTDANERVVLTP